MRYEFLRIVPCRINADFWIQKSKTETASGCFNFKALWLQCCDVKVTPITSKLLSILLEIEALGWGQGNQDCHAAA